MKACLEKELLSAYIDREATPAEERRVQLHLADCEGCRRALRLLGRLKVAVRSQPVPPLPADLRASLEGMAVSVRKPTGWRAFWEFALVLPGRRMSYAAAAALAGALCVLAWRQRSATVIPVEVILAAHNQYALTMPLAAREKIMSDLPIQISYGGGEEGERVY